MKVSNGVSIASDGTLARPQLHDARLIGIIFPADTRALILARDVRGTVHCIEFTGIERFRAEDLREGNIILDVSVRTGTSVKPEDLAYPYGLSNGSSGAELPRGILERLHSGEVGLIQLDSSYGCSFSCICTGISVIPNWASVATTLS